MDAGPTKGDAPTPTGEAAPPATPVLAAVIATRARGVTPGGVVEVRLRLDPPSLGEVGVRIRAADDGLQIHLVFESAEAAACLSGEQARLREELARCGLALGSFSTSVRDSLRAGMEGQGEGARGRADEEVSGRWGDGATGRRDDEILLPVPSFRRFVASPGIARLDARV